MHTRIVYCIFFADSKVPGVEAFAFVGETIHIYLIIENGSLAIQCLLTGIGGKFIFEIGMASQLQYNGLIYRFCLSSSVSFLANDLWENTKAKTYYVLSVYVLLPHFSLKFSLFNEKNHRISICLGYFSSCISCQYTSAKFLFK